MHRFYLTEPLLRPHQRPRRGLGTKLKERLTRASVRCCVYCGSRFGPANPPTLDHLLPLSHGGTNTRHNLVPCCYACNQDKGEEEPYAWIAAACPPGALERLRRFQRRAARR